MQTLEAERENVEAANTPEALTGYEPCDKCGARAKARAKNGDFELYFCAHHIHKLGDGLIKQNFEIFPPNWQEFGI